MKKLESVMLYVDDVNKVVEFWNGKLNFVIKEKIELPEGYKAYEFAPLEHSETVITVFPLAFIEKYSPEVSRETPSLMFETDNIEQLYREMKEKGITVGEIVEMPGRKVFNFADDEDHYFAVNEKYKRIL